MKAVGIIPARYQSSRFPGKPLVDLAGKPMIVHVLERCSQALGHSNTYAITDDERIAEVVRQAGFQVIVDPREALTGTDRVWLAANQVHADIYLNIQGDEPLINPEDIKKIKQAKEANPGMIINGYCRISEAENPASTTLPKVVINSSGRLLYMSRLPVPGNKNAEVRPGIHFKQVCVYAFNYEELKAYGEMGRKSLIEEQEDIEILRFFEWDIPILMVETSGASLAVDTPEDAERVNQVMARFNPQQEYGV